jgi:tetratricopeptide (TPR) repeat protein
MVNLIDTYDNGQFLGAMLNTIKETFPYVNVVTSKFNLASLRNTFVVIATKNPINPEKMLSEYNPNFKLWHLDKEEINELISKANHLTLTDNFAPVENLLAPVVRQSADEILARKYMKEAREYKRDQNLEKSIQRYRQAAKLNPSTSILAYNEIGLMLAGQGKLQQAASAFQAAVDYHDKTERSQDVIGSIYLNLGILYRQMNQEQRAQEYFHKAIKQFEKELAQNPPEIVNIWSKIGNTYAFLGDFENASKAFQKVLQLEPRNPENYINLIRSLKQEGKYSQAIEVAEKQIQLIKKYNPDDPTIKQLNEMIDFLKYQSSKK